MALIRAKVPGVASRAVVRDLPDLLERYSPVRQIVENRASQDGEMFQHVGES
ncbi:MAG: hypothetical protein VX608_12360 [Chloroflexota bacterium]|nr:hypothetical protein [Chloroflexota bacterium]